MRRTKRRTPRGGAAGSLDDGANQVGNVGARLKGLLRSTAALLEALEIGLVFYDLHSDQPALRDDAACKIFRHVSGNASLAASAQDCRFHASDRHKAATKQAGDGGHSGDTLSNTSRSNESHSVGSHPDGSLASDERGSSNDGRSLEAGAPSLSSLYWKICENTLSNEVEAVRILSRSPKEWGVDSGDGLDICLDDGSRSILLLFTHDVSVEAPNLPSAEVSDGLPNPATSEKTQVVIAGVVMVLRGQQNETEIRWAFSRLRSRNALQPRSRELSRDSSLENFYDGMERDVCGALEQLIALRIVLEAAFLEDLRVVRVRHKAQGVNGEEAFGDNAVIYRTPFRERFLSVVTTDLLYFPVHFSSVFASLFSRHYDFRTQARQVTAAHRGSHCECMRRIKRLTGADILHQPVLSLPFNSPASTATNRSQGSPTPSASLCPHYPSICLSRLCVAHPELPPLHTTTHTHTGEDTGIHTQTVYSLRTEGDESDRAWELRARRQAMGRSAVEPTLGGKVARSPDTQTWSFFAILCADLDRSLARFLSDLDDIWASDVTRTPSAQTSDVEAPLIQGPSQSYVPTFRAHFRDGTRRGESLPPSPLRSGTFRLSQALQAERWPDPTFARLLQLIDRLAFDATTVASDIDSSQIETESLLTSTVTTPFSSPPPSPRA